MPDAATPPSRSAIPDVGRRLTTARLRRSLSQGTVARRAGIAATYLSRVENGKIQPTFRTVMRIASAMRLDLEELVGPRRSHGQIGACPVTQRGHCLLDLIRPEDLAVPDEHYTPREVKLLRNVATWMKRAPAGRVRALEVLLEDLMQATRGE